MHATGMLSLASKTLTVMSAVMVAPIPCELILMTGGEVNVISSSMSSFGYFLYNCGIMNFQLAVFNRD